MIAFQVIFLLPNHSKYILTSFKYFCVDIRKQSISVVKSMTMIWFWKHARLSYDCIFLQLYKEKMYATYILHAYHNALKVLKVLLFTPSKFLEHVREMLSRMQISLWMCGLFFFSLKYQWLKSYPK